LEHAAEGTVEKLAGNMTAFTPSGDLFIEYALDDQQTAASAWAFSAPSTAAASTYDKTGGAAIAKPAKAEPDPVGTDPFVAIALRPKLPKWADTKPRDQVVVLDVGRAMVGERLQRAKRLTVQLAQEMDRRDRITVLACDTTCKAMPGGFLAPGAPTAHDVDA